MSTRIIKGFEPKIIITITALNKMKEYIRQSNDEIGWLCTSIKQGRAFIIMDAYLFNQEVNSVTTEITTDGLNEFAMEVMQMENGLDIWNNMKVWGHSHVNMSTSPSGQDEKQMEVFTQNADDFFIRIIGNKKGEMKIDLYDYEKGVIYEDLTYAIDYEENNELINTLEQKIIELQNIIDAKKKVPKELSDTITNEIKSKVKKKKEYTCNKYDNYYGGYNYSNNYDSSYWKNNKNKKDNAFDYFDMLTKEEVFELMIAIETEGTIVNYIKQGELSVNEIIEVEDMVAEYCQTYPDQYQEYLDKVDYI